MKDPNCAEQQERCYRSNAVKIAGAIILLIALSGPYVAADETWPSVGLSERDRTDAVDGDVRKKVVDVEKRLKTTESSLKVVESSLKAVELRLGRSVQPPTPMQNFERRVQEVERRLDAIERNLKKLDTLEREMKRMDDRLRRVENKK